MSVVQARIGYCNAGFLQRDHCAILCQSFRRESATATRGPPDKVAQTFCRVSRSGANRLLQPPRRARPESSRMCQSFRRESATATAQPDNITTRHRGVSRSGTNRLLQLAVHHCTLPRQNVSVVQARIGYCNQQDAPRLDAIPYVSVVQARIGYCNLKCCFVLIHHTSCQSFRRESATAT